MNCWSAFLSQDWFAGFVSGVGDTVLGFVLTLLWDVWKLRNERIGRENAISNAVSEELRANKSIVDVNLTVLRASFEALATKQTYLKPIAALKTALLGCRKDQSATISL